MAIPARTRPIEKFILGDLPIGFALDGTGMIGFSRELSPREALCRLPFLNGLVFHAAGFSNLLTATWQRFDCTR